MKLGALKSAIRDMKEAPRAYGAHIFGGRPGILTLQKTPLLAELDATFPEGRAHETGLYIDDDGFLAKESKRPRRSLEDEPDDTGAG